MPNFYRKFLERNIGVVPEGKVVVVLFSVVLSSGLVSLKTMTFVSVRKAS